MRNPDGEESTGALLVKARELMQRAAASGNYKEVQRLARIAEELSTLEKQEAEIDQRRQTLSVVLESNPLEKLNSEEVSARERGNRVRRHYVEGVLPPQGVQLEQIATKKYRTPDQRLVGIAYAKELGIRPSFWFLGLSDEHFDFVILLCESSEETAAEIAALVLPPDVLKRIWKALSRSHGQVKFHVARTGYMNFELRLPGSSPLNVSQYLNGVQALKKR